MLTERKKIVTLGSIYGRPRQKNKKKNYSFPLSCCHCQLTIRRRPEYSTYLRHLSTYTTPLNVVYPPQRERVQVANGIKLFAIM